MDEEEMLLEIANDLRLAGFFVRSLDLNKLEQMQKLLSRYEGGAALYVAMGSGVAWLNGVVLKKNAMEHLIKFKEEMDKLIEAGL